MEDELRLFLLLGGSVFIIGVLAHGIWKIRKNSKPVEKERLEPREWSDTSDNDTDNHEASEDGEFDELGVGSVRVIGGNRSYHGNDADESRYKTDDEQASSDTHYDNVNTGDDSSIFANDEDKKSLAANRPQGDTETSASVQDSSATDNSVNIEREDAKSQEQRSTLYGSVITNPKPHLQGQSKPSAVSSSVQNDNIADFPEPPGFLLKETEESICTVDDNADANADSTSNSGLSAPASANVIDLNDRADGSNGESVNIPSESKKYQRSEVPKATSTLYVDATKESFTDNSVEDSKIAEGQFSDKSAHQRIEPSLSGSLREKGDNESVASNHGEIASDRKRFSKTKRTKPAARKREEPNFGDDQMRIDFDDNDTHTSNQASSNEPADAATQEVLILNVRAKNDSPISGAALLPMLLTLGFKFGDQDIFHRHVNSNGKGPVLFSLANMFKPGVFDIDNLENFDTQGISLFMILPIEGDPHQVFNMMHNAARKLADEFDAQVLDGRRSVLTKQGLQQYVEKIREFERKRMISRS